MGISLFGIGNDHRANLPLVFKNTQYDDFIYRASASFSFANTTKIAFVQFNVPSNIEWLSFYKR